MEDATAFFNVVAIASSDFAAAAASTEVAAAFIAVAAFNIAMDSLSAGFS
jgi:hypothetical protein